jgi:hypothetical protein
MDADAELAWRDLEEMRAMSSAAHLPAQPRAAAPAPAPPPPKSKAVERVEDEDKDEEEKLRVEKRCVRYAIVRERLVRERGKEPSDVLSAARLKRELNLFGTREWRRAHVCGSVSCTWQHWPGGQPVMDPFGKLLGGRSFEATGMVWVCERSGAVHLCGPGRCGRGVDADERAVTCPVSGLVVGETHVDDTHSMNKPRFFSSDGDSGRHGGAAKQRAFQKLYKVRTQPAQARSADEERAARKRTRKEEEEKKQQQQQQQDPATGAAANNLPPYSGKKKARRKRLRVVPEELPPSAIRNDEQYGETALLRQMEIPSRATRDGVKRLCQDVVFWEGAEAHLDEKLKEAEHKAYRKAERYFSVCRDHGRMPSRSIMRKIYLDEQQPVLEKAFGQAWLATCERQACVGYFTEALLRAYALVACTPMARKEQRCVPFTHVALGLLRGLADGISLGVWFNRETRRARESLEVRALPDAERDRLYECRTVRMLPAHRALRGVPSDQDMRETGRLESHRYFSHMVSQRKVKEYLDSLVASGLTIEQIEAYSLERYMRVLDIDAGLPLRAGIAQTTPSSSAQQQLIPLGGDVEARRKRLLLQQQRKAKRTQEGPLRN